MKLRLIIPLLLLSLSCSHVEKRDEHAQGNKPTLDTVFVQWLKGVSSTEVLLEVLPESIRVENLSHQTKIVGNSEDLSLFRTLVLDNYPCKFSGSLAVCRATDSVFIFHRIDMTQTPWGEAELMFYK